MGDFEDIGLLGLTSSGQTVCNKCLKVFNNRAVPQHCDSCNHYLGGKFEKKETKIQDAKLITANLASVRTNQVGLATRTFVDVSLNKVKQPEWWHNYLLVLP